MNDAATDRKDQRDEAMAELRAAVLALRNDVASLPGPDVEYAWLLGKLDTLTGK